MRYRMFKPELNTRAPIMIKANTIANTLDRTQIMMQAQARFNVGDHQGAVDILLAYHDIERDYDLLHALTRAFFNVKDYDNCMKYGQICLAMRPTTDIILLIGHIFKRKTQYENAIFIYKQALQLPNSPQELSQIYDYIGHAHVFLLQFAQSQDYYQEALRHDPQNTMAWLHIINGYNRAGDYAQSVAKGLQYYQQFPRSAQIDINIALSYMSLGDFHSAWRYFTTRFETKYYSMFQRPFHCPIWQGQDLRGKKLFVQSEQGIGDQLIFSGYLRYLPQDCQVFYACDKRFAKLMGDSFAHITMIPDYYETEDKGAQYYGCDYYIPICSLPFVLQLRNDELTHQPYLQYNKAHSSILRHTLSQKFPNKYKIGFAWWSLAAKDAGTDYRDRLIDPKLLVEKILAQSPAGRDNTLLVSLQYNQAPNEEIQALARANNYPIYCEPTINNRFDLDGLASLTMAMDNVVSIHQSIVHFCGALGQKCTVLLPYHSNWQYQASQEKLIWYESVRILRKNTPDETWDTALNRLQLT